MARILWMTIPAQGHITPTLAVVEALVGRGHAVSYLSTPSHAATVAAAGAEPILYATSWSARGAEGGDQPTDVDASEVAAWAPLVMLTEAAAQIPAARRHLDETDDVSLLVYDTTTRVVARSLAHAHGLVGVEVFPSFASAPGFSLTEHLPDPDDDGGSAVSVDPGHPALVEFHRLAREILTDAGGPARTPEELAEQAEQRSVVFVPRRFQPGAEAFDPSFRFVGPALDRSRPGGRRGEATWAPPADGRPVVLLSWGTEEPRADAAFLRDRTRAFVDAGRYPVVSTGSVPPEALGDLGPHAEAAPSVPQPAVLAGASAFVTHAGMGSTMEGLFHRVPLVATPKTPEQAAIARRIEELGLGTTRSYAGSSPADLVDAVDAVTDDPSVAAALRRFRDDIDDAGGPGQAADDIEDLLPLSV
ncbi:nucleotide disphospho-sugar-binding domain-containing protein [Actinomycetospora sp. OC33-EN08]|uniref:Nucleotide disphospho-sugar-binding domain-containing protein n=1 Tax=Actinomycetospora aurantiaca TaxID=3129233 RepID=A0ABU8MVS9_9PSEU